MGRGRRRWNVIRSCDNLDTVDLEMGSYSIVRESEASGSRNHSEGRHSRLSTELEDGRGGGLSLDLPVVDVYIGFRHCRCSDSQTLPLALLAPLRGYERIGVEKAKRSTQVETRKCSGKMSCITTRMKI